MKRVRGTPIALVLGGLAVGCGAHRALERAPPPSAARAAPPATASAHAISTELGRHPVGAPSRVALPLTLLPIAGGRSLLAVSEEANDRRAWARRIDGADGAQGALLSFDDAHVAGAFEGPDGATIVATTTRTRVCLATFAMGSASPSSASCADATPVAVARLGGRIALVELDDTSGNTRRGPVSVRIRWMTPEIDAASSPTGLSFERPLAGMTVVDAASRGDSLDLLFYESVPGPRPKGKLGRARLGVATLGPDGALAKKSRRVLAVGALEFGHIAGRRSPKLVTDGETTALVTLEGRDGPCRVVRAAPTVGRESAMDSGCAVDPIALAADAPMKEAYAASLEHVLEGGPRRAPLQSRADAPLVVLAGGRAYFVAGGELRSLDRVTGEVRVEPYPLAATRSELSWWAVEGDGEGVAMVDGRVVRVESRGVVTTATSPEALAALAPVDREAVRAPSGEEAGRVQIARIGESWWVARRSVVRVVPSPLASRDLAGRAVEGATALVGGRERGMFLELSAGALVVHGVTADGELVEIANGAITPSPVGFGFEAAARAGGGAVVTGPSAVDPRAWVTFDVDALGVAGEVRAASRRSPVDSPRRVVALGDELTERAFETIRDGLDVHVEAVVAAYAPPESSARPAPMSEAPVMPRPTSTPARAAPCPADMVLVAGHLCVDRFEATLVDAATGARLSPDYPATPSFTDAALADFATGGGHWGDLFARATPLPPLAVWQLSGAYTPRAVSRPSARPNGYVQGLAAEAACAAAGKRLCTAAEFRRACRGERDEKFPYGPDYVDGACNVDRDDHPALALHGNASFGHLDPRLDRVVGEDGALLHETGATPRCRSVWGGDAIYDMVGNLDEWVDDGAGAFAGGFYARQTREGCDAIIHAHPKEYLDYSTGVRCCGETR